ncbi:MAG TPA: hypothetical protein VGC99_24705 [Candidatus Tectomicrobia bacterium]
MDGGSLVIGLGGLIVGGLSTYLSYKSRTSPYQEKIYSKQLEGYTEVVAALTEFYNAAQNFIIIQPNVRLDDATRPKLRMETKGYNAAFGRVWQKWAIFFPKEINDSFSDFIKVFNGISAHPDIVRQYPKEVVYASDPGGLLGDAYSRVIAVIRKRLGTDPLSQETLKLIGRSGQEPTAT